MEKDFSCIHYLKEGNNTQRKVYTYLKVLRLFECLQEFTPLLTGTIPIGIDIESSDIDIICHVTDFEYFSKHVEKNYGNFEQFRQKNRKDAIVFSFLYNSQKIEIFGQNKDVSQQNAYLHMIAEHKLLSSATIRFKEEIINLKKSGLKTEPAFGRLLRLDKPYETLKEIADYPKYQIVKLLGNYAKDTDEDSDDTHH